MKVKIGYTRINNFLKKQKKWWVQKKAKISFKIIMNQIKNSKTLTWRKLGIKIYNMSEETLKIIIQKDKKGREEENKVIKGVEKFQKLIITIIKNKNKKHNNNNKRIHHYVCLII